MSIASSGMPSSSELLSLPFVVIRDNASVAWSLISARCTTLKSNSDF